ncbi:MAG TPA: NADP-dependent oxidoreductase [Solirubrobacteraceae bacterium]|nr:NADP-dependent oxidoreductase [Solirubrobacteraceae bacterium]
MRVAGIESLGGQVEMIEVADPRTLRPGEVLIAVRAAGVGNWDDIVRGGGWDVGRKPPMALGVEAAGVVAAVGPGGGGDWSVGDEVMTHPLPLADQGTWGPSVIVKAERLARKPADVSWAQAAAFPVPALTAVQALDALHATPGETLLVNGAGGVTGGLIVSLGVARGLEVLATAGPSSREHVLRAGATAVVDYHDPDWPQEVLRATGGRGVDGAANTARGGAITALQAVRDGGRLATITSDPPGPERGIGVDSIYVRPDAAQLETASQYLGTGRLELTIGASFPLEQADAALNRASAGLGGAVVLEV